MRCISLEQLYVHGLTCAHATPPTRPEEATSRWSTFSDKPSVLQRLLRRQLNLCCYSEVNAVSLGFSYHIEHVENKSQNPQRTFDETNLAACALSSDCVARLSRYDVFGGHSVGKSRSVDMEQFISCYLTDSAKYFSYLSNGYIVPNNLLTLDNRNKANYTINLLNLNCNYLINKRRLWWKELEALYEEHKDRDWDLKQLIYLELIPTTHSEVRPFFSMTRQFFGSLAENVLLEHAPELL